MMQVSKTTMDLVVELTSSARSRPCNHPKPHTTKATARLTSLPTCETTKSNGTTRDEPPALTKNMHLKLSGTAQMVRLAHLRWHWESSTPAMFSPSLSAPLAKSTKTLASSLDDRVTMVNLRSTENLLAEPKLGWYK
ncbi:hypothetical protein THAOC_12718, partial [Thalassiosira oceanica]